jgi:hypothetical protein
MENQERTPNTSPAPEADRNPNAEGKRAYEKPAFLYQAPLEAMAAVCTPRPPGKGPGVCSTLFS